VRGEGAAVFNSRSWNRIVMEPVDFEVDDDIPREIKPYRTKVPHNLEEAYKRDLQRLTKYLYVPSNSSKRKHIRLSVCMATTKGQQVP
jgi:hypothetical protein